MFKLIGSVLHEPIHPFSEAVKPLQNCVVDHGDGEQWNQPDHRTHFQRNCVAVFVQVVVVEAVFFVPQPIDSDGVHCVSNLHIVLKELAGHVGIRLVLGRKL